MKKNELLLSLISAILFFVGIIFKHQHWIGAGILIILGAATGIIFLSLFLTNIVKLLKSGIEKTNGIITAITMIIVFLSFTFKFQHWPGGNVLLYIAHVSLFISSIIMFVDAFSETDNKKQSLKGLFAFIYFIFMSIVLYLSVLFNGFQAAGMITGVTN